MKKINKGLLVTLLALALLSAGCSKIYNNGNKNFRSSKSSRSINKGSNLRTYDFAPNNQGIRSSSYVKVGEASWYGPGFHGKKSASGAKFNKNSYSAAHRTLPMGSIVMIKNLGNGKKTAVIVNDRGPAVPSRIIDVSEKAAIDLGFKSKGCAKVKVEYLPNATKRLFKQTKDKDMQFVCSYFNKRRLYFSK